MPGDQGEAAANADRLAKWEEEMLFGQMLPNASTADRDVMGMQQLQRVATEHDEAKGHIERLTEELQASKVHCSDLEKELEEKGTADASQQVEELQSLKTKLSSAEGSLKTEIEAKKKLATEISDLQSQLAKASGNKAQMEELRRELTERNKDLAEARETAAAARGTCAEEVENASKALDEQRRMATEASQRLDDAQRELASLKAQVSQQIAAKAEEECRWQQQITTEKSLQKGLQAEVDELKKQLASAKESNNQQEQRTQERLEQAQREVDQLKVDLSRHDDEKQVDEKSTAKLKVELDFMNVESEALRVVLDDETVVTLPKQVSPMLASLEGLFEGEAFSVPSASGITKVGLFGLKDFIERAVLPRQWPSETAAEFVRAASFLDVNDAIEAAEVQMAERLLECEDELQVHLLAKVEDGERGEDADEAADLARLGPTLGVRGLAFARSAADGLLQLFSMDFLRAVILKAEAGALEAPEIQDLQRELCRGGRGHTRRAKAALESAVCKQNRGNLTLAALVLALSQDHEAEIRATAFQVLSQLVPRDPFFHAFRHETISVAVRALSDVSAHVRKAAVNALLAWSPLEPPALQCLEKLAQQKSGKVKAAALQAMSLSLQEMPISRLEFLLLSLEDSDEHVQFAVVSAFAHFAQYAAAEGHHDAVEVIADRVSDKMQSRRHWVKRAAAASLQKLLECLDRPHLRAKSALLACLADVHDSVRSSVALALPHVGADEDVSHALVGALQDPHAEVRKAAGAGLVLMAGRSTHGPRLAEKLVELLDCNLAETRCMALMTLQEVLTSACLKYVPEAHKAEAAEVGFRKLMTHSLSPRLMDPDGYVRIAAARTAGCFTALCGRCCELSSLLATVAARDDDEDVRSASLEALASASEPGDRKAQEVAVAASKDPSPQIRRQALALLCSLSRGSGEEVNQVLSAVCALISDSDDDIRRLAMQALPEIIRTDSAGVLAIRALGAVARSRSSDRMAVCALEAIAAVARCVEAAVSTRASALSPVTACLTDENWIVREAAENAVATLKAELDTWRAECRRLSEASQTEVPKMQALLEEEKVAASRAKAEAIEGLAQLKAQAAATAAELEARSKELESETGYTFQKKIHHVNDRDKTWDFASLLSLAQRLARSLRQLWAAETQACVAFGLDEGMGLVLLQAGMYFLPLDLRQPRARLESMLMMAGAELLIAPRDFCVENFPVPVWTLEALLELPDLQADPGRAIRPQDLCYVQFTSGSTGQPKGVLCEHRQAAWYALAKASVEEIDASSRVLLTSAITFDPCQGDIFCALAAGAALILAPRVELLQELSKVLLESEATHVCATPALWQLADHSMLRHSKHLRCLSLGGEKMPAQLVERWASSVQLRNIYGVTEATVYQAAMLMQADTPPQTAGLPFPGTFISLQPWCDDTDTDDHEVGEICLAGSGIARGYLKLPDLTSARFVAADQKRCYLTGDAGRWVPRSTTQDGQRRLLQVLGRRDLQVKLNGERVELGEVEHALSLSPLVAQCAVVPWKSGTLLAYLVLANEVLDGISYLCISSHCEKHLPRIMRPRRFVDLQRLPLTSNGKTDRAALPPEPRPSTAERLEHRAPEHGEAPRGALEEAVAAAWAAEGVGDAQMSRTAEPG
ncbi:Bacitracin synthase 3 (BA3) [Includes: ATP-dependent isoleucine adenylase (IleA) (Isoleucine activase) [Durusdinium trenchii]|uniref:Bacitracin synthase 3 (BA3) n=1 Tax=Durusdinium trenchii TaxID=1381693 RepID=A0ABP0RW26_9DINO